MNPFGHLQPPGCDGSCAAWTAPEPTVTTR